MKPLKVEFQAFGPYASDEVVDFEALSSKGLFLICGKTGIGKTMILDAITFALYGKSSGHGRDDLEAMRCTNAAYDQATFVRFTFENQGSCYCFERRLERKRKNLSASYNLMKREDGAWRVMLENAKEKALNDQAVEIIGLDYEQFRQVIVLPQGQFEKLLTANSEEKEKILTTIFGEEKWQRIAELFYLETEERKNRYKGLRERIQNSLMEEQCSSLTELSELIERKRKDMEALEEEYRKADPDRTIRKQQELLALSSRFSDLKKAGERVRELKSRREERALWEEQAKAAKRSERVRPLLDSVLEAGRVLKNREAYAENEKKNEEYKQRAVEEAAKKLLLHLEKEKETEEKRTRMLRYEEKRRDYQSIASAEREWEEKKREAAAAESSERVSAKECERLQADILLLREEYGKKMHRQDELLNAYLSGITGELAAELKEGEPCPVCGSTDHPKKAESAKNSVTRAMVDRAKEETDRQYTKLREATAELEGKKAEAGKLQNAYERAIAMASAAGSRVEEKKQSLVDGIDSLKALEAEIKRLQEELHQFARTKEALEKEEKTAKEELAKAKARIETSEKEKEDANKAYRSALLLLKQGLKEQGFADEEEAKKSLLPHEELLALNARIASFDAALETEKKRLQELKKELSDREEPEAEACRELLDRAMEEKSSFGEKRGSLGTELQRLEGKFEALSREGDGMEERIRRAEEDFAFAKGLRGDSGVGLQRYVLGILFSHVVAAANKMLEMVHGGRYRLFRSDDKAQGTNKRGLELKVYDKYSMEHEGRFVSTLSGGEKFLVSLALSIGMSTVAQHSGIRIEALFIDEGFGSLDEASIDDAMSVLKSVQEANGLVGIISHVQLLRDQIANKLSIVETENGSHIVQTIG